jgi:hypothetical protein
MAANSSEIARDGGKVMNLLSKSLDHRSTPK